MKIFIDADGCPVVDLTVGAAVRHCLECLIICDTSHRIEREDAETIIVSKGSDSVDYKIVNMIESGDIVVTQDYGLAAMVLARKGVPITQNGMVITEMNIDFLLASRYESKKLRNMGVHLKGPKKRTAAQDESFLKALNGIIEK